MFGDEEVGVRGAVPAADTAAELVEIGEAEVVGAVDEDGVGVRDVDAVFDDGGGDEDVGFAGFEGVEDRCRSRRRAIWPWPMPMRASGRSFWISSADS